MTTLNLGLSNVLLWILCGRRQMVFRAVSPDLVLAAWMGLPRFRKFRHTEFCFFCLHSAVACVCRVDITSSLHSVKQQQSNNPATQHTNNDNQGVFSTFPRRKKVRRLVRAWGRNCSPSRAHPRGQLIPTSSGRMSVAARGC